MKDAAGTITSKTEMKYNNQGRLSELTITTTNAEGQTSKVTQEYIYDESGIKIRQTETTDNNGDGVIDERKDTTYVNDAQNHTGYSQVLEERETTTNADGTTTKTITYTIGHDVLSQFTSAITSALAALGGTGASLFFLYDGHGSNRGVTDTGGQKVLQAYHYDAYGNATGFQQADGLGGWSAITSAQALTNLLYSGEQTNPTSGLQYLRARWYNPQAGTFNRLDPFAGDLQSPLSLHKYAYTHNNPVMGIDPTGEFAWLLVAKIAVLAFVGISLLWLGMHMYDNWDGSFGSSLMRAWDDYASIFPMLIGTGIDSYNQKGLVRLPQTPTGVIQTYKTIINAQAGVPPELLATVLLTELRHYNINDFAKEEVLHSLRSFNNTTSYGIAQIRIDTIRDHGYLGDTVSDQAIFEWLMCSPTAIVLLAQEIMFFARHDYLVKEGIMFWDTMGEEQKKRVIIRAVSYKDTFRKNENGGFSGHDSPFGRIWGVESYDIIKRNNLLK